MGGESLFSFEVTVREVMTHRVYVNARSAAEAREKARSTGNWIDDEQDYAQAAPITVVGSVKKIGEPL